MIIPPYIPSPESSVSSDDEIKKFAQKWLLLALETCHSKPEAEKFLNDCLIVLGKLRSDVVPDMLYETCPYDRIIKYPVGFIQRFLGSENPKGWITCDGREFSTRLYPKLSAMLASQGLDASHAPDLRDDIPPGTVQMYFGWTAPSGWFLCNGQRFDPNQYPKLSYVLQSNGLDGGYVPDMRESVPVGAGQNSVYPIATHDVYGLEEFRDDQMQQLTGTIKGFQPDYDTWPSQCTGVFTASGYWGATDSTRGHDFCAGINFDSANVARSGTVTHGKQIGVSFIMKHDGNTKYIIRADGDW